MIYILVGDDTKNINNFINGITKKGDSFEIYRGNFDKNLIMSKAGGSSLFKDTSVVVLENILNEEDFFSFEDLDFLKKSDNIFLFKEDKMLLSDQKKYKKYAEIKIFENKKIVNIKKFDIFTITNAYENKDKVTAWTLYIKAINEGIEPEAISGVLFWKIKSLLLKGSKNFTKEELKNCSSKILSIYHMSHRGEMDFVVALEQFILETLSSNK